MSPVVQGALAIDMPISELSEIATQMDADDRVDLFNHLGSAEQQNLLNALGDREKAEIRHLFRTR